jgi:hypothetical protein
MKLFTNKAASYDKIYVVKVQRSTVRLHLTVKRRVKTLLKKNCENGDLVSKYFKNQ